MVGYLVGGLIAIILSGLNTYVDKEYPLILFLIYVPLLICVCMMLWSDSRLIVFVSCVVSIGTALAVCIWTAYYFFHLYKKEVMFHGVASDNGSYTYSDIKTYIYEQVLIQCAFAGLFIYLSIVSYRWWEVNRVS